MKIISHRGNLNGPNKLLENNPEHILNIISLFDVEIDVWYINSEWSLGHDEPQYNISINFFNSKMWLHCKNLEAVEFLSKTNLNWFWHEQDKLTLTSHGNIWCFPNVYVDNGIVVELGYNASIPKNLLGVCTDYPLMYKK